MFIELRFPFFFFLSSWNVQYIGSLEVGRPGSRMEIVAAMRRIRVSDISDPFELVTR